MARRLSRETSVASNAVGRSTRPCNIPGRLMSEAYCRTKSPPPARKSPHPIRGRRRCHRRTRDLARELLNVTGLAPGGISRRDGSVRGRLNNPARSSNPRAAPTRSPARPLASSRTSPSYGTDRVRHHHRCRYRHAQSRHRRGKCGCVPLPGRPDRPIPPESTRHPAPPSPLTPPPPPDPPHTINQEQHHQAAARSKIRRSNPTGETPVRQRNARLGLKRCHSSLP